MTQRTFVGCCAVALATAVWAGPATRPAQAQNILLSVEDLDSPQIVQSALGGLGLAAPAQKLGKGMSLTATLGAYRAGTSRFLFDKGYLAGAVVKVTNTGTGLQFQRIKDGKPTGADIQIGMEDYFSSRGVSELATYLCLKPKGPTGWMLPGDTFTAVLGPSGAGKSTLIFDRGYKVGQEVTVTHAGRGMLRIEGPKRLRQPDQIHIGTLDYYTRKYLQLMAGQLGLRFEGPVFGMLKGDSLTAVVGPGKLKVLLDRGYKTKDRVKLTNTGGDRFRLDRLPPSRPLSTTFAVTIKKGNIFIK